jgi:hypothetical protein
MCAAKSDCSISEATCTGENRGFRRVNGTHCFWKSTILLAGSDGACHTSVHFTRVGDVANSDDLHVYTVALPAS